jgi:hypothetical protein
MMPVNSKSMFALLMTYMEKLDNDEVDASKAVAMSKLIQQADNLLNYELKRGLLMTNPAFAQTHRNIELKTFDSLPE